MTEISVVLAICLHDAEATLLHESSAHRDAVLSLDLCEAATSSDTVHPEDASLSKANGHVRWILSVGTDRVVKAWSVDLQRLGQLTSVRFINSERHALAIHTSFLVKLDANAPRVVQLLHGPVIHMLLQEVPRVWTPLGNRWSERRRSVLRAAGLNLAVLRQRLRCNIIQRQDNHSNQSEAVDENVMLPSSPDTGSTAKYQKQTRQTVCCIYSRQPTAPPIHYVATKSSPILVACSDEIQTHRGAYHSGPVGSLPLEDMA